MFHIVYTPGSVRYLSFFAYSLLEWSDASFCLVANGCSPAEVRHLQNMADEDARLEFTALPGGDCVSHGKALDHLQAATNSDLFCFMDSDILATGEFMLGLTDAIEGRAGVFSGSPIWVKRSEEVMPSDFRNMLGTFNRSEAGIGLGVTYVAMYDNNLLTRLRQSTGLGFDGCGWSQLPSSTQNLLAEHDQSLDAFDTAKVLNLLLAIEGEELLYVDLPSLCHIGGVSFETARELHGRSRFRRAADRVEASPVGRPVERYKMRRAHNGYRKMFAGCPEAELEMNISQRTLHRNPVRRYFTQLMSVLHESDPIPPLPQIADEEIADRFRTAVSSVVAVREKYSDMSDRAWNEATP